MRHVCLALFLVAVSSATLAGEGEEKTEVKSVVQRFHQALDRHDVVAIEALVSADIVVLENGHRNDGWPDFRDNHLIPEFKEPATASKWEFLKVAASSEMAWAYTKETINATGSDGKPAEYLVWSAYVLQKAGPAWKVVLLNWSVMRLNSAN